MVGVSKIEIIESSETLLSLMRDQPTQESKERVQVLYWLKSYQVRSVTEAAKLLGRHRVTVQVWLRQYRAGGLMRLLAAPASLGGRKSKVPLSVEEELKAVLETREGFGGYQEVVDWLEERGVTMTYAGVHGYVRGHLGASLKVPRPQSIEQDGERMALFKKRYPPS